MSMCECLAATVPGIACPGSLPSGVMMVMETCLGVKIVPPEVRAAVIQNINRPFQNILPLQPLTGRSLTEDHFP